MMPHMAVLLLDPRFPAMIPVEATKLLQGDVAYTEEVPIRVRWVIADLGGHVVDDSDVLVTTDITNEVVRERLENGAELIKSSSLLVEMEGDRELPAATEDVVEVDVVGEHQTPRTEVPAQVMDDIEDAVALIARALRQGEWERSQTHESLIAYLREETEELAEVVAHLTDSTEQELCRELADIFLQVLFHAEIANRRGAFDIGHVAEALTEKLRARAPYLFEEVEREVPIEEQDRLWVQGKLTEKSEPRNALAAAEKIIREARALGLADSEIPTDIRFPMVGLEMDKPGQAEQRLHSAVSEFRKQLSSRASS